MKKKVSYFIALIITLWIAIFITDNVLIKSNKSPLFCITTKQYSDGGSTEFYCLGYKINRYVNMTKSDFDEKYELGTWSKDFITN
jgi:hypothetical protein